jgi:transposase
MEPIYTSCCGLDVHSRSIAACIRRIGDEGRIDEQTQTFGTMTRDIMALSDWLCSRQVTHVAMESTGVYWKPIYNILEGHFTILLVNARHVKHVPGRKTDISDCQWLAQLLQCGLLKGSFVPERPQRELRDLTRHRAQLVADKSSVANRIHKVLEDANIKLATVATDILGVSGRDMIQALICGDRAAEAMADLARRQLRSKIPQLQLALEGHVTDHHRFVLKQLMDHLQHLEQQIEEFTKRIEQVSRPFEQAIELLCQLPGYNRRSGENVLAEIGIDMNQFPSEHHLASWAGICPGNHESAGKRKQGTTTKGSRWLRSALVQSAWAATRKKGSYYQAQYRRLVGRRGKKRALIAVAHSQLIAIYHMLKYRTGYRELGSNYFDKLNITRLASYHIRRLKTLGYEVNLTPLQEVA